MAETFEENISPDYLIPILSHITGQTIVREKTLIVFDEVQLCERTLTSLKYFYEDAPEYMKTLYPMDMEEFMLALGGNDLVKRLMQ